MCSILPRTVAWLSNCWEPELLQRECSHSLGMPNQRKLGGPPLRFIPEEPNFFWAPILKSQELVPQLRRQTCVTNRFLVWLPNHSICCCLGGGAVRAPIMVDPEVPLIFPTYPPSLSRTTWERIKCTALKKKSISFITLEGEKSEFRASGNYTVHILHNYDVVGGLLGELVKFVCYFLFF